LVKSIIFRIFVIQQNNKTMDRVEELYDEINVLVETIGEKYPSLKGEDIDEMRRQLLDVDVELFEQIDFLINRIDEEESEEYFNTDENK